MQAVVVHEVGSFRLEDRPQPEPGPREVLVRVAVTGVCRTDLKIIRHGHRDLVTPRVPGEEVVGRVEGVGSDVDPSWLKRRVYVYPGTSCGRCRECRRGAENLCEGMRIMGFHRDGGFAGFVAAPVASLIPLPDDLPDEQAVFAEPLSCCLNALVLGGVGPDDVVGVWGAGTAGTLLSRTAKVMGARPLVVEVDESRRRRIGGLAGPPPQGVDAAVVAVGNREAYLQALAHLNPRGRLVVFSGLLGDEAVLPLDLNSLHYREQTLVGAYGCSFRHGVRALELIARGDVPVADLVTRRLPLHEVDKALTIVAERTGMKVLLYPHWSIQALS